MPSKTEPQELPPPWPRYRTLLLVDLEFELGSDELGDARHHSLPRSLTAHVNVAVVRISGVSVAASLQFPVQLVEYDVREQRGDYSPNAKDNFSFDRMLRYR